MKQLFSSIIASMDASSIHVTLVKDFEDCGKVIRDDGAGEVDPDILAELAMASNTSQEDIGPSRSVVQSAQIRCAGLKGMLLGSKHLQGTRKVEVPRSMLKFGESFEGEHLHVLNFSRIRPTFLGSHLALLLEACGCDTSILIQEHVAYLKKVGNYNVSREDAFDQLRFAQRAADDADGEKEAKFTGGMRYLGTFLRMLQAGFSPQQHPLLEQVLRQKAKALLAAQRSVHIRDVWSARGHPEPGKREELQLHDNEIFLMVPCDGEERSGFMFLFSGFCTILYMHSLPCVIPIPDGLTELPRHLLQIREPRFNVDTVDVSFQRSMEQTLFSLWLKRSTNRDSCKKLFRGRQWCVGVLGLCASGNPKKKGRSW